MGKPRGGRLQFDRALTRLAEWWAILGEVVRQNADAITSAPIERPFTEEESHG